MKKHRDLQVRIVDRKEKKHDLDYWLGKTPEERIEAVEFLREQYYVMLGYKESPKLIPHLEIRPRK